MWKKQFNSKAMGIALINLIGYFSFQFVDASWSTPLSISSTISDQPDISVDSAGNIVVIWQSFDGNNYVIQASALPVNGSWSTPVTLSSSGNDAENPIIDHDSSGNVVAVWSRYDGSNSVIQSAQLPIGGSWSTPVNISASGGNADSCLLAMDTLGSVGNAVAVWHRFNGSNFIVQGAILPSGGSWSSATNISASGQDALVPQVDVDSSGNAVITCNRYNGEDFNILSASQLYSQSWSPNFTLSVPGDTSSQPMVGVDKSSGTAYVMWSGFDGSNYIIQSASLVLGGSWTSPMSISASGEDAYIPYFVVDLSGNVIAIWVRFDGSNYILQGATLPAGGSWSTPSNISAPGMDVGNIDICVDQAGNATAVWDLSDGTSSIIQASTLPANGSWSTPVVISTPGEYAYLPDAGVTNVDSTGNVTAVWIESNDSFNVVKTATLSYGS